jgi:hypothetical protein
MMTQRICNLEDSMTRLTYKCYPPEIAEVPKTPPQPPCQPEAHDAGCCCDTCLRAQVLRGFGESGKEQERDALLNDILDICKSTRQRVIDSEDVITDWCSKIFREVLDFPIETRKIIAEEITRVTCFPLPEGKRLIITLEDDSGELPGFKTEEKK